MTDIIHFTTVHRRADTRIRYKEATTLAELYPSRVALYVQDGLGNEVDDSGLLIVDTGRRPTSRIWRMFLGTLRMYKAVLKANPTISHFHDPELIPAGLLLHWAGIKVIYDIHEDVPKQILTKTYIKPAWLRVWLAKIIEVIEAYSVKRFAMAVPAVPSIANRFPEEKTCVIRNVPKLELLTVYKNIQKPTDRFVISYAGSLNQARGIEDLVSAMDLLPDGFELQLLGPWHQSTLQKRCEQHAGWRYCKYLGQVPHSEVGKYIQQAHLGVQLVHDVANYRGGLATKVFEYLALGIPTLMSDTAERRETYGSLTLYAKPADPEAIAAKILDIRDNYHAFVKIVDDQHAHILKNYSWDAEACKLKLLYDELLD